MHTKKKHHVEQKHMQATWAIHASRILRYDVTMKMSLSTYCFSVVPWSVVRDWTTRWPQMYSWCLLEFMIISFAVACDNSLQVAFLRLESRHKLSSCEVLWIGSDRSCIYVKFVSLKARSHRQNVAGAFLERWGEGTEFWQRSSPRTKWQTKSKTRALP